LPMFLSSKYFDDVSCLPRSSWSHCVMSLLFQEQWRGILWWNDVFVAAISYFSLLLSV
jgi:hypothetical protein